MLENYRIGTRLVVLVGLLSLLVAAVMGLGLRGMALTNASLKTVYEDRTVCLVQLGTVERDLYHIRVRLYAMLGAPSGADHAQALADIKAWDADIRKQWADYTSTYIDPDEKILVDQVEKKLSDYLEVRDRMIALLVSGDVEAARTLATSEGAHRFDSLETSLVNDIALQDRIAKDEYVKSTQTFQSTLWINILSVIFGLGLALGLAVMIVRSISRGIAQSIGVMQRLAADDLAVDVVGQNRSDEIGDIARAVAVFKDSAVERRRLESEQREAQARREARQQRLENLTRDFDRAVMAVLDGVSAAAHKMNDMSKSMSAIADETERQGTAVSAATEQASANVSTIASTSNELSASIQEIARQVNRSADIAAAAVTEVGATNQKMESLARGAARIGEVVNLINDIASQTNLLALNATIEAARAGDAGKGFAVVAGEVKNLANQTARATGEIADQIQGIQGETRDAVEAMGRITEVINQINEMSAVIASAIEEQGAAIQEVARNVDQAAQGTREVSGNISQVVVAAGNTGSMASQVQTAAGMLSGESEKLRHSVEGFLSGVKAA